MAFEGKAPKFIDIETNFPYAKAFNDIGQLAVDEVRVVVTKKHGNIGAVVTTHTNKNGMLWQDTCAADIDDQDYFLVGHNFIRFDAPVCNRLLETGITVDRVYDTLIASKIIFPEREAHSLESWAEELGSHKTPLGDSLEALVTRCYQDVDITMRLYQKLEEARIERGIPMDVLDLEFRVADIVRRQHERGVEFNVGKAIALIQRIDERMAEIQEEVGKHIPPVPIPESKLHYPPKVQFKKDGTPNESIKKYIEKYGYRGLTNVSTFTGTPSWQAHRSLGTKNIVLPLTEPLDKYKTLDLNSPQEIKDYLLKEGWKPTLWNRKKNEDGSYTDTSPKLYDENKELCPNLEAMGIPGVSLIAEFLTLRNRRNVIQSTKGYTGWLNNTRVQEEGRICPDADTLGADTHRFTHKIVANVPRVKSLMGKEMRELFEASPGMAFVGWDASSLEACMEAHYTHRYDGGEYAKEIMQGDIHTKNMHSVGLKDRDAAKKFKYAITYGARPKRLQAAFGWPPTMAQTKYDEYWKANPALAQLVKDIQAAGKRGWIKGLDGRRILVDSPHSALNRLLQSAGAIVMKYAMVIADRIAQKQGLDAYGLIRYHDEEQWECASKDAEALGKIGVYSIQLAGKYLKLNVPLTGEYKIGKNWSDTH